jgi:hypothetical protein
MALGIRGQAVSEHHRTGSYSAVAKRVRPIMQAQVNAGQVMCRRCLKPITSQQQWDVSHIVDAAVALASGWPEEAINSVDNLESQHRGCNRSAGGRLSQSMTAKAKTGQDLKHGSW